MPNLPARRATASAALAAALLVSLAGCGGDGDDDSSDSAGQSGDTGSASKVDLTVLAASSLTDVFKEAGDTYQKEHPGTRLKFSFAGSQELAAQVKQAAPADVLVTADQKTMDGVSSEITGKSTVIAKNRLVIAVGEGNPKKVATLKDLGDSELKVVLAAPEVPVGNYSRQVLDAQHVTVHPVSEEPNVRAVLSKVELGEADAGVVYKTDAATATGKVDAVTVPDEQNAIASYPAATLKASSHTADAQAFVKWLATPEAQKILQGAGFQKP